MSKVLSHTHRRRRRHASVSVLAGSVLSGLVACSGTNGDGAGPRPTSATASDHSTATIPTDLQPILATGDVGAVIAFGTERVRRELGTPFPDVPVRGKFSKATSLRREYEGKPIAILLAALPCGQCEEYVAYYEARNWRVDGYEKIVTLVINDAPDDVNLRLRHREDNYFVQWPLGDYLAYIRFYPIVYYVSSEWTLEGFEYGQDHTRVSRGPLGNTEGVPNP